MDYSEPACRRSGCSLALATLILTIFPVAASGQAPVFEFSGLPLAEHNQWALFESTYGLPTYVTATASKVLGNKRQVRLQVDQAYLSLAWILNPSPGQVAIEGVTSPTGRHYFDETSPLFREGALPGETWQNELGTVTLVQDGEAVQTPVGTFSCREFRIDFRMGGFQSWCLAAGVGPVRITDGLFQYLLLAYDVRPFVEPPVEIVEGECPRIGIEPNPPAGGDFSLEGLESRFQQSVANGFRFLRLSATWAELEPEPGQYDFSRLRPFLAWANREGIEVGFTLKSVDTNTLSLPGDLKEKGMADPEVLDRHDALLRALAVEFPENVRWVELGNEVDTYFLEHRAKLTEFRDLFRRGKVALQELRPAISIGIAFAYSGFRRNDAAFQGLSSECDHIGFTYYPLLQNFQVRKSDSISADIAEMVAAAGVRPLILTEIGFPSATELGSDLDQQRKFYSAAMQAATQYPDKIKAVSVFLMSDIPESEIEKLAKYYSLEENQSFLAFLRTLGLRDLNDIAKPAWDELQDRVRGISGLTCRTAETWER